MTAFLAALQFLTRVPVRLRREPSLVAAVPWFPVVGGVVGSAVGAAAAGLWHVVPAAVGAAVAVLLGVFLTGAFHEDGLADIADAFAGGWTREARLRILDDPLHGSYGVAALCGSIVLRVIAAASIAASGPAAVFATLVAAHATSRAAAVGAMGTVPVAKAEGLGAEYARSVTPARAAAGVTAGLGITVVATGWWALPFAAAALLGAATMSWLAVRKIGGISGDVLGGIQQVSECLVLVVASGLATRHTVWWR